MDAVRALETRIRDGSAPLPESAVLLADMLAGLGHEEELAGQHQQALDYYLQALDVLRRLTEATESPQDEDYYRVADILDQVAGAALNLGDFEAAVEYFQDALEMRQSVQAQGTEYQTLLASSMHNLGSAMGIAGNLEAEVELYQKALEILTQHKENESTARLHESYAAALGAMGNFQDERKHIQTALDIQLKLSGNVKNQAVSNCLYNLGFSLAESGEMDEAKRILRECLDARISVLGKEHADTQQVIDLIKSIEDS
jgi:tetratricopeptide (TPR) repeat protein